MTQDGRPVCDGENQMEESILCLAPETECETFTKKTQQCFDADLKFCIDWNVIVLAIIASNIVQIVFEAAIAYSVELTFKPTYLDRMQDPDNYDEVAETSANNPDQKSELNCGIVMAKCWGELMGILLYLVMISTLVTGLISQLGDGKPMTCFIEFGIALVID